MFLRSCPFERNSEIPNGDEMVAIPRCKVSHHFHHFCAKSVLGPIARPLFCMPNCKKSEKTQLVLYQHFLALVLISLKLRNSK